ncbi:dUTP diphosphatase [Robertmurraya siralis]|uniref:dUTP diphosphatase n=1 Tax=Robertmurraya siralis TaxID=77777 RepID=UPI0010F845FA|nr:dUTP diphosphatase [Robertmurraya siralis]
MNLSKLFETQKVLRNRIKYEGEDRFEKLILALLVELGECANEWRGFKFWSKDQQPRTKVYYGPPEMPDVGTYENPLLEEYVDGLHFILELGLEYELNDFKYAVFICDSVEKQFIYLYRATTDVFAQDRLDRSLHYYRNLIQLYFGLGEMLGFTWEEVEQAYYKKNKVNHHRQDVGY